MQFPGMYPIPANTIGWTIIQRRVSNSVSFNKPWDDYVDGFGAVTSNFWLGLQTMHELTAAQPMRLQIDIVPFHFSALSINYQQFIVGDASSDYQLTISGYSTTASDATESFNYHSGQRFTTSDRDNDEHPRSCANDYSGGWWFKSCWHLNLNGIYEGDTPASSKGMRANTLSASQPNDAPLKSVIMMIKPS